MDDRLQSRARPRQYNRDFLRGADVADDKVDQKTQAISDRLTYAYQRAASAFIGYIKFKDTRGSRFGEASGVAPITRPPSYPDSHIMTFSILAGLVLFEGLANAYFFSKGSDLGLLGGWIQAITVAGTNVVASFFVIGFLGLRMLQNPHRPFSFAAACVFTPLAAVFIVFLNWSAAHYRDLLELNAATLALGGAEATGEILAPVTRALEFRAFETLEALLLFILGLTFAIIAAFKGATFDDRLIGYGAAHRKLVNASAYLAAVLKQLPTARPEEAFDEDGEPIAPPDTKRDGRSHLNTRRLAIQLKHEIDELFADEVEDALEEHRAHRRARPAGDAEAEPGEPYATEPPPRA